MQNVYCPKHPDFSKHFWSVVNITIHKHLWKVYKTLVYFQALGSEMELYGPDLAIFFLMLIADR